MSTIKDILTISLDEEIKSVIDLNSQDEAEIVSELNGFILTESLAKHLNEFCEEYVNGAKQSGIWLSGFYGSGKSYFAKMLGFLIKNPVLMGTSFRERFAPKLTGLPDADIIENNIRALNKFKSHVVLFDSAKYTNTYGLSFMLFANFLRSLGLVDNWIGLLEYNLLLKDQYDTLKRIIQEKEGQSWEIIREDMTVNHRVFKQAYMQLGYTEDEYKDSRALVEARRKEYDATKLSEDLQRYLRLHEDTRIVFMIDEVSEAITQNKIDLHELEGMAEALASMGRKVWTIAIAQLKLGEVISSKNVSANELTKVRDRFRTTIDIKADEADVIIKQRLLAKKDAARKELMTYFNKNSGAIRDITNLPGLNLHPTTEADNYADYYPFYEYQFRMLQYFLFGSSQMVQTKVGTRGMIISAFDVLKKEVKRTFHEHAHVTATQLCNQAELNSEEEQRMRYEQAANTLNDKGYKFVEGKKLLQTIHFLAKTDVTQTTAENICRAYVDCPEDYYKVLEEIKNALEALVENQIVLTSGNQYRITNQTEQRILEDMKNYDVPAYVIRTEITRTLKGLPMLRSIQSLTVEQINVPFQVSREDGEPIVGSANELLKVLLYDIFVVKEQTDPTQFLTQVKQTSQNHKDSIYIVPDVKYASDIAALVTEIKRIEYISQRSYSTDTERTIVHTFEAQLDQKKDELVRLLDSSYANGTAVYQYNTYGLSEIIFDNSIKQLQKTLYDNIYTKRLSARLSESLAPRVLTEQSGALHRLFGASAEFKFFDTSGKFIGANLAVVQEILAKATVFISGADLEKQLGAPPTGYNIGTIVSTMAALFRGNKVIAKYNGQDVNSVKAEGAKDIFANVRNFTKASFKAVSQSLSYRERQDIIDILKDDCHYKAWTGETVSYNMNDFDVVDAIRQLSKAILSRINHDIALDEKLAQLFSGAIQTKAVFQPFTPVVNEANCFTQARLFLSQQEEYIKAVERVEDDLDFIEHKFSQIESIKDYLYDMKQEMQAAGSDLQAINEIIEKFDQCYTADVVKNYAIIQQLQQEAKDAYFARYKEAIEKAKAAFARITEAAEKVKAQLEQYKPEWNKKLAETIEANQAIWKKLQAVTVNIPVLSLVNSATGKTLRDVAYAVSLSAQEAQKPLIWQTEIVTSEPTPQTTPQPIPASGQQPTQPAQPEPKPQPKVRKMKAQLPSGKKSVKEYRLWLTQQLTLLTGFDANDELDFNN